VIHTTLAGLEPTTFRLLVRRATSSATDSPAKCGQLNNLADTTEDKEGGYIAHIAKEILLISSQSYSPGGSMRREVVLDWCI